MPTPPSLPGELNVVAGPGRFRGEARVVLTGAEGARAHGLWCSGRPESGVRPWVDLHDADPRLLAPVARALGPGGAIMVAYGHGETERALRRKVPPAATSLGLALLRAGCRWMKDWYFAEGGREGHAKLHGELPLDDDHRRRAERALRAELDGFLKSGCGSARDHDRARQALRVLGEPSSSHATPKLRSMATAPSCSLPRTVSRRGSQARARSSMAAIPRTWPSG